MFIMIRNLHRGTWCGHGKNEGIVECTKNSNCSIYCRITGNEIIIKMVLNILVSGERTGDGGSPDDEKD